MTVPEKGWCVLSSCPPGHRVQRIRKERLCLILYHTRTSLSLFPTASASATLSPRAPSPTGPAAARLKRALNRRVCDRGHGRGRGGVRYGASGGLVPGRMARFAFNALSISRSVSLLVSGGRRLAVRVAGVAFRVR